MSFRFFLSKLHFHLEPCNTTKVVIVFIKLTSNQLLIICNFKVFSSSDILPDRLIIFPTYFNKNLSPRIEDDSHDPVFIPVSDHFYPGDLLEGIKGITLVQAIHYSSHAWLTIRKSETKWKDTTPLHLSDR